MKHEMRYERTGTVLHFDGKTSEPLPKCEAAAAQVRMITRQRNENSDTVPEDMTAAEYARQQMLNRMYTPPCDRQ